MAAQKLKMTLDEFVKYALLPENANRRLEFIDGEIVDMAPSRTRNSEIGDILVFEVRLFCREHSIPCHTTSGDGAYDVQGNTVAPDFAYKPTPMSDDYPDPDPPLWAVEVISPNDEAADIRAKRQIYQEGGVLLWEIYPKIQSIDVYASGKPPRTVGIDGTLDGDNVLPEFTLPVRTLFAE
jgi:Uma2 family endonuclease